MHANRQPSGSAGQRGGASRPRVVILDVGGDPRVEVLELPVSTTVGSAFRHLGREWRVVGLRPSSRVLIAKPN